VTWWKAKHNQLGWKTGPYATLDARITGNKILYLLTYCSMCLKSLYFWLPNFVSRLPFFLKWEERELNQHLFCLHNDENYLKNKETV